MTQSATLNEESTAVHTHLKIMQSVIARMAENSRSCKVWCVTLVAAVLVLVARTGSADQATIALAPTVLFYVLDAYYLSLERAYRRSYRSFVDKSVSPGDIHDESLPLDEIRRRIRDDHIAGSTVTIVLIGPCTWQRKHVDWEISASLIDRRNNRRCGLLGLLLPSHPDYRMNLGERNPRLIPQRLANNIGGNNPFATLSDWPGNGIARLILPRIQDAHMRRDQTPWPDNSLEMFAENRSGDCSRGWQN